MESVTLPWRKVLDLKFGESSKIDEIIAEAIMKAVKEKRLIPGSAVPPYRAVARYLGISRWQVGNAWKILHTQNKIFTGEKGAGFKLAGDEAESKAGLYQDQLLPGVKERRFDLEYPDQHYSEGNKLWWSMLRYRKRVSSDRVRNINENDERALIKELKILIHDDISLLYKNNEIYYMKGYLTLINQICTTTAVSKPVAVLTEPASRKLVQTYVKSGKKVKVIGMDAGGLLLDQLEEICKSERVGFVHIMSRGTKYGVGRMTTERIEELIILQKKYKFIIIETDALAGFSNFESNLLMNRLRETQTKSIYIRPLSVINEELSDIAIMAGPANIIRGVSTCFSFVEPLGSKIMLLVLQEIMSQQKLRKHELIMKKHLLQLTKGTRKMLLKSGIWKENGICTQPGWFFYLEPKQGCFPCNVYQQLQNRGFHIHDPDWIWCKSTPAGILISLAKYLDKSNLPAHLEELDNFLKTIINSSTLV